MIKPMSDARRRSRLIKQGKIKSVKMEDGKELYIPTEKDVEKYINDKINKKEWDVIVKEENL
jgi:hypothetical protein